MGLIQSLASVLVYPILLLMVFLIICVCAAQATALFYALRGFFSDDGEE